MRFCDTCFLASILLHGTHATHSFSDWQHPIANQEYNEYILISGNAAMEAACTVLPRTARMELVSTLVLNLGRGCSEVRRVVARYDLKSKCYDSRTFPSVGGWLSPKLS